MRYYQETQELWYRFPYFNYLQEQLLTNAQPIPEIARLIPILTNAQPIPEISTLIPPVTSWRYPPIQDPFSLSFREYCNLTYEEALELQNEVYRVSLRIITDAWRRGKRQVVICDGKIIYETESLDDIPNEKANKLGREYNKAIYVFSAPDIVEESAWGEAPLNLRYLFAEKVT